MTHAELLALKARLPRTWPAFFERYGSFSATQAAAIPALLGGANVLLCAPTASGKTAAALAPLLERHCPPDRAPGLRILYITPTRALANDLAARLAGPLDAPGLTLGVKTGDNTFRPRRAPDLLLTTPESADSLLSTNARLFATLHALIIDELHLFDGTPRGDQLRVILNRVRRIRAYAAARGEAPAAALQYAALSATMAAAEATVGGYFWPAQIVRVSGQRVITAEQIASTPGSSAEILEYLASFRARGWRKALVFCNSRAEVEAYAAATRPASPFGSAVYAHYSNIDPRRRREIEQQFGLADAAICFASSTLELGIDIGDIDVVMLIGPPGSSASFLQRIGRGNRRGSATRVACFHRTPLERLLFAALLHSQPSDLPQAEAAIRARSETGAGGETARTSTFRPAVAVQQLFSLIKQSPTAALRLAELAE
ncbi:MAG: DEAD/DEAH box helicase, partial [Roseiflexaceae bacterium]|nr:DEAD/DEAH box helicase [Roseiflexaceae bacterium]